MSDFSTKQGDSLVEIPATLVDKNGAVDLTGASIIFVMAKPGEETQPVIEAAAEIVSATEGKVRYVVQPGDLDEHSGTFNAEWRVTFTGGAVISWPNRGYQRIEVPKQLSS